MALTDTANVRARAKRAYEVGRLRLGTAPLLLVLALAALSCSLGAAPQVIGLVASALALFAVGFVWRGGAVGRAVFPGLLAGTAPLLLPVALRHMGYCCIGGSCVPACMLGCISGGLLAGVMLSRASMTEPHHKGPFLGAASLLTFGAGSLGCSLVGVSGLAGIALSVTLVSLPAMLEARRA
jgi:hypothetical protein